MKSPHAGMNVSSEPAKMPGSASGSVIFAERGRPAGVEVGRRLDQPLVDLLQRDVQRQRHEGQEVVGDARDHRRARGQQPPLVADHPDALQRVHDEPVVGQDQLPAHRPQHVADEERQDDQQQHQVPVPARLERDEVRQRERDHEAQDRRRRGIADRAQEVLAVLADDVRVGRERPVEDVAGLRIAGLQRHVELVDQRDREEDDQPQQTGPQEEPGHELPAPVQRQAEHRARRRSPSPSPPASRARPPGRGSGRRRSSSGPPAAGRSARCWRSPDRSSRALPWRP